MRELKELPMNELEDVQELLTVMLDLHKDMESTFANLSRNYNDVEVVEELKPFLSTEILDDLALALDECVYQANIILYPEDYIDD